MYRVTRAGLLSVELFKSGLQVGVRGVLSQVNCSTYNAMVSSDKFGFFGIFNCEIVVNSFLRQLM